MCGLLHVTFENEMGFKAAIMHVCKASSSQGKKTSHPCHGKPCHNCILLRRGPSPQAQQGSYSGAIPHRAQQRIVCIVNHREGGLPSQVAQHAVGAPKPAEHHRVHALHASTAVRPVSTAFMLASRPSGWL